MRGLPKRLQNTLKGKGGLTLVEVLASTALLGLLLATVLGLVVPFTEAFVRLRRMQSSQQVADALLERAAGQLRGAREIAQPTDGGQTIAFLNPEGYVVVLSTAGKSGVSPINAQYHEEAPYDFPAGRACQLYCALEKPEGSQGYAYRPGAALGFDGWMGAGFYGSFQAAFDFELPAETGNVPYVKLTVTLTEASSGYSYAETAVIDLSNDPPIQAYAVQ